MRDSIPGPLLIGYNRTVLLTLLFFVCLSNVSARSLNDTGDSTEVIVSQNSTYLLPGEEIKINVFLKCNSKYKVREVTINGMNILTDSRGVASYTTWSGSLGIHKIPVRVTLTDTEGNSVFQHHVIKYEVAQTTSSIDVEDMNILYIGIKNKVWIHVGGVPEEKIVVKMKGSDGKISKSAPGEYLVTVSKPTDEGQLYVYSNDKLRGAYNFRVRNLPTPLAIVGKHISGDSVTTSSFLSQTGVSTVLKDFAFPVKYEVINYEISLVNEKGEVKKMENKSAVFSPTTRENLIQRLKPGILIIIGNVLVKTEDGRNINLAPIIYYVK